MQVVAGVQVVTAARTATDRTEGTHVTGDVHATEEFAMSAQKTAIVTGSGRGIGAAVAKRWRCSGAPR